METTSKKPGITELAPRILNESAEWFKRTFRSFDSGINNGLEYILNSFPSLYRQTLRGLEGRFSREELMLMIDSGNGILLSSSTAGQYLALGVADSIALDQLDKKWGIKGDALNAKLTVLSLFESVCMELWVQAYWVEHKNLDLDQYVAALATRRGN